VSLGADVDDGVYWQVVSAWQPVFRSDRALQELAFHVGGAEHQVQGGPRAVSVGLVSWDPRMG